MRGCLKSVMQSFMLTQMTFDCLLHTNNVIITPRYAKATLCKHAAVMHKKRGMTVVRCMLKKRIF